MHYRNIKKVNKIKGIVCILIIIISSCNKDPRTINSTNSVIIKDSITYLLSEKAMKIIDSFCENNHFCYIGLVSNSEINSYYFTIYYQTCNEIKSNRKRYLINKSNRFLKTKKHIIPIILEEDLLFALYPKDSINFFQCKDFGVIKVNAKGEFIDGFSYE